MTPAPGPPRVPGRRIAFTQLASGALQPNPTNATWVSGRLSSPPQILPQLCFRIQIGLY